MQAKNAAAILREGAAKIRALNKPSIKKSDTNFKGLDKAETEYKKLIDSLMNQEIEITAKHIEEAKAKDLTRIEYFYTVESDLNEAIYEKANDIEGYVKTFYDLGKKYGFNELEVEAFTGQADAQALFSLSNYNFGLIKNLNDDLREGIRQEIWKGVLENEGPIQIADMLRSLNIPDLKVSNRTISADIRANAIARTESMNAVNQGLYMSFAEYGIETVNVEVVDDDRLREEHAAIAEKNPWNLQDLIDEEGLPPFDVNCRCTLTAADEPNDKPEDPQSYFDTVTKEQVNLNEDLILSF